MKRTVSFVLCLILLLGLAAPSVRAYDTGDDYSDILDNIVIEEGASVNITADGVSVTQSQETKLPNPADLVTTPAETIDIGAPVLPESCECVDLASAEEHLGVCVVKVPYMELCQETSAEELFAQWSTYSAEEQSFLMGYLQEKFPLKHFDLQKLLTAPTGAASELLTDGTTVSVEGIPQDGSLTVVEAADEVKDIVDAYVAENAEASSPLFGYDVSIRDGEGAQWQPDTNVKMELELPGEKLHKNTKVFVVHVDDDGVATTIEAQVTEDGKIAFETPGFSAFYGFTVDFHYEDVVFSIPGMSSIKLSELFAELNVPLNASDVVALEYTDDTQLQIEQLEGDWLLTSLKAFDTEEKLTMTMADGSVYEIKVTDAEVLAGTHTWHIYNGYFGSYNHIYSATRFPYDGGNSATSGHSYNALFNGTFYYAYEHAAGSYYEWDDDDDSGPNILKFDNTNQNTTVNLLPITSKETLVMDMVNEFYIRNGANVTIQVDPSYTGVTKQIIIRSANPEKPLFSIVNSSLTIKGSANTRIILDFGADSDGIPKATTYPLIWENGSGVSAATARSLYVENVTFRNATVGAVDMHYSQMTNITFKNCSFESSVDSSTHGGAIRHRSNALLAVTKFEVTGCTFDGNSAGARGGAIALEYDVGTFTITDCQFSNCVATTHGGAISLRGNVGSISITGTKTANASGGYSYTTSFTNCSSTNRGGALAANCASIGNITVENILVSGNEAGSLGGGLHFGNTDQTTSMTGGNVSVSNCDFKDNMAHGVGGGLCVTDGIYESISITNSTFDNCDTTGYGGAIGLKSERDYTTDTYAKKFGVEGDISIIGCSFRNCLAGNLAPNKYKEGTEDVPVTWDHDGDPATAEIDQLNGASGAGAMIIDGAIGGKIEIRGADEEHPTVFENCLTWNSAGAIFFTNNLNVTGRTNTQTEKLEAVTLQYLTFEKCFARDAGSAIYFSSAQIPSFDMSHCLIQKCGYFDAADENFPEELITISKEWFTVPATNPTLVDTWLTYEKEDFYPGTDFGGTFRTVGNTACAATISDCEFINNRSYSNGGAVYWNANQIIYQDPENKTTPLITPSLTITNTPMHGNYAGSDGGALFCEGMATIESCEIYENTAGRYGGGIAQNVYNNASRQLGESGPNEAATVVLKAATGGGPVKIYNNAARDGGGISISVSTTNSYPHTVKDGVTEQTEIEKPSNWNFSTNFTYSVKFQLGGSHVYENKATRNGGGIFYNTTYYMDETGTPEDGVSWAERQRQVDSFVKDIQIDKGLIYSNTAGYGGAGGYADGCNGGGVYMSSSQVNTEETIPDGQKTGSSTVTITGGSIYDNKALVGNGGGIYLQGKNAVCTVDGGIVGATAKEDGTPDVASANSASKGTVTVSGESKTVGGNGGGIAIFKGARIEMDGGFVVNNTSNIAGGGIAVHSKSSMWFTDGTVENNTSHMGGGISLNDAQAVVTNPTDTTPDKDKYGMFLDGGVIKNNTITSSADGTAYGGGICISAASTMKIDDGEISGNKAIGGSGSYTAGKEGGGIAVCQGSTLDIYGGTIKKNNAHDGGGVVVRGRSFLNMHPVYELDDNNEIVKDEEGNPVIKTQGLIQANEVNAYGGGIASYGSTVHIYGGQVINNKARDGGGGYFHSQDITDGEGTTTTVGSTVIIDGATVSENVATTRGGGWIFRTAMATINGGVVSDNTANSTGGGIFIDGRPSDLAADTPNVTINGGTVSGNKATSDGGGIWIKRREEYGSPFVAIYGGMITKNTSDAAGGGIFIHGDGDTDVTLKMYGGTVSENTASARGGGVNADNYATVDLSSLTVDNKTTYPTITGNTANRGGGIAVCYGAHLTVKEGYITYNKAIGTTNSTTARLLCDSAHGVGGGIWVAEGASDRNTYFKLDDEGLMAIYGNIADFAGDDVFSNGENTELIIPEVKSMDLAGFGFKPEGWFEDYNTNDSAYGLGLNMRAYYDRDVPVLRYRNAVGLQRMHIEPAYVTGDNVGDAEYVNKENAYVAMTLGLPAAVDDTVVVDFSGPVNIDLYQNDLFITVEDFGNGTQGRDYLGATLPKPDDTTVFNKNYVYFSTGATPVGSYRESGTLYGSGFTAYTGHKGVITFSPVRSSLKMDQKTEFCYTVLHNGYWYYAKVTVIPASTLYFEDNSNYITYHTTSTSGYNKDDNQLADTLAEWKTLDSDGNELSYNVLDPQQFQDRPGSYFLENLDADNIYGYDDMYLNYTKFSNNAAHKVSVKRELVTENGQQVEKLTNARATFSFTGTGFDIISLCNQSTGVVMVSIYEEDTYQEITFNHSDWQQITQPITSFVVDTWYQVEGQTLYQVPVIKADMTKIEKLDPETYEGTGEYWGYGTYTVELYIAPGWYPTDHSYSGADFYLDAIRIYSPAGYNGSNDKTIQDAYIADGEGWPTYAELRNMFINEEELSNDPSEGSILFIDMKQNPDAGLIGVNKTPTISDYTAWGPNNEIYLAARQSISFTLDASRYSQNIAAVHLGMRALTGGMADVKVQYKPRNDEDGETTVLWRTKGSNANMSQLSATDMYYDVTAAMGSVLMVVNYGDTPIAISNLKVTHTSEPVQSSSLGDLIYSDLFTAKTALDVLTVDQLADPVVTPERPTLSFNGMVCYNVFFSAEDLGDLTAADLGLAVFNSDVPDGTVETADEVHLGATEINGEYMIATDGVNAKYLGDTKYFRAFARKADGSYVYSKTVSYSAREYAENVLAKSEDVKLKQLVIAMLNYGTEAQKFFGYKTEDLMNKNLTADHQALVSGFDADTLKAVGKVDAAKAGAFTYNGGFAGRSPAVSFNGAFEINYFMTPSCVVEDGMIMYFWSEDTYNSVTELTPENADKAVSMTLENGTYTACSDEIIARNLDQTVYVAAVYESDGVTYCSGVLPYSIAQYCRNASNGVQALSAAAAIYGCAAKAYFVQ